MSLNCSGIDESFSHTIPESNGAGTAQWYSTRLESW